MPHHPFSNVFLHVPFQLPPLPPLLALANRSFTARRLSSIIGVMAVDNGPFEQSAPYQIRRPARTLHPGLQFPALP